MKCLVSVSYAPDQGRASWLHEDIPCGPRQPRTHSPRAGVCGLAKSTGESWTNVGSLGIETRQAFQEALLLARREALASTAKHLRNQMRCSEASSVTEELRAVTNDILAQGSP